MNKAIKHFKHTKPAAIREVLNSPNQIDPLVIDQQIRHEVLFFELFKIKALVFAELNLVKQEYFVYLINIVFDIGDADQK